MKIKHINTYHNPNQWFIYVKEVEMTDFKRFINFIKNLSLKRDYRLERHMDSKKLSGGVKWDQKNFPKHYYKSKFHFSGCMYNIKGKNLGIDWNSKNITGEEFVSLWFSNL